VNRFFIVSPFARPDSKPKRYSKPGGRQPADTIRERSRAVMLRIELSPEREAALRTRAQSLGLSVEDWLLSLVEQAVPATSIAHLQKTDPEEWARQFRAWADSHDPNTPVLSEAAMSRESLY
jgi:hypothetical protein